MVNKRLTYCTANVTYLNIEQENKEHMQSEEHMSCKGINNLAYIGPRIQNGSY